VCVCVRPPIGGRAGVGEGTRVTDDFD